MDLLNTPNAEIKGKSPFGAYENEEKVYDGRITPISIDHIMFKVNRGEVHGVDFVILEALSILEFATSRMVTQYLYYRGIDMQQMKVHNRLKFMNKINIITRFKFVNEEQEIKTRVYCLQKAGKYLLISRNYPCKWKPSDSTKPLEIIKQILARNQVLLTYLLKVDSITNYEIDPVLKLVKSGGYFSPHLLLTVRNGEMEKNILFEVVRSFKGFEERLQDRLQKYEEFYEYFRPSDKIKSLPDLVFVGENDVHAFEIHRIIKKQNIKFKGITQLYTTDLQVLDEDVSRTLMNFEITVVNGKPKANVKIGVYAPFKKNLA